MDFEPRPSERVEDPEARARGDRGGAVRLWAGTLEAGQAG